MTLCSRFGDKVGDKGQRYEIRFYKAVSEETSPGVWVTTRVDNTPKVFGWAPTLKGAREMLDACGLAPWALDPWIVDRQALTVRKLIEELGKIEDPELAVCVASLETDEEHPWANATNVGRTPDGRVVID